MGGCQLRRLSMDGKAIASMKQSTRSFNVTMPYSHWASTECQLQGPRYRDCDKDRQSRCLWSILGAKAVHQYVKKKSIIFDI